MCMHVHTHTHTHTHTQANIQHTPTPILNIDPNLSDLNGVISQEVVQHHLPLVPKHVVCVVPVAIEAQHMTVVVQELFQGVILLIGPQWLHALVHLQAERLASRHQHAWGY